MFVEKMLNRFVKENKESKSNLMLCYLYQKVLEYKVSLIKFYNEGVFSF